MIVLRILSLLLMTCTASTLWGQSQPSVDRSVVKIQPGTVLNQPDAPRWNRTILLAKPRIASGDVNALSESIRQAASTFVLSIAATVDRDPAANSNKFRLAEVGVGYSVRVDDRFTVIRPEDYEDYGVSLSFVQRQMLSENQKQLETIRVIARGTTLLMFDVPSMMLHRGEHVDFAMRHLIWIDSNSGKLATMVWLNQLDAMQQPRVADWEAIRWLEPATFEDRTIHVDGDQFTLLIPGKRAFALERLPPGRSIAWTAAAAKLGALDRYDMQSMQDLLRELNAANLASR